MHGTCINIIFICYTDIHVLYICVCYTEVAWHISIVLASVLLCLVCSLLLSPQDGKTPLWITSHNVRNTALMRILLENKADPNICDNVSYSILYHGGAKQKKRKGDKSDISL